MAQDPDALLAIAAALGIPIPEAYRSGVARTLQGLLAQARLVMNAAFAEEEEPPAEFEP